MPKALNAAIELHDSVVESVARIGGDVRVALRPAYIHKSIGNPGVDSGSGFVQDVILEFGSAQIEGEIGDLPADVFDGDFQVGSQTFPNMISLPSEIVGAVLLTLFVSPDNRRISISGEGIRARLDGESQYIEEFPG